MAEVLPAQGHFPHTNEKASLHYEQVKETTAERKKTLSCEVAKSI